MPESINAQSVLTNLARAERAKPTAQRDPNQGAPAEAEQPDLNQGYTFDTLVKDAKEAGFTNQDALKKILAEKFNGDGDNLIAGEDEFDRLVAEYQSETDDHDGLVENLYHDLLGRESDAEGKAMWSQMAAELKAEGKSGVEIREYLTERFKQGEEYQGLHPEEAQPGREAPGGFGDAAVEQARALQAAGYKYPPDLGAHYYHKRFEVGCCADFACDSWAKAGVDVLQEMQAGGFNPHYTPSQVQYFKQSPNHSWHAPGEPAQPGDMVFFRWPGDSDPVSHVAIVTGVDGNGKPSRIIESSSFNQPAKERDLDGGSQAAIVGYGRA